MAEASRGEVPELAQLMAVPYPTIKEFLAWRVKQHPIEWGLDKPQDWMAFRRTGATLSLGHICGESNDRHIILVRVADGRIIVQDLDWHYGHRWRAQDVYFARLTRPIDQIISELGVIRLDGRLRIRKSVINKIKRILTNNQPE